MLWFVARVFGNKSVYRPGAGVLDFDEVPVLVVEVASDNWREDYIRKRAEYALIDIPEYWIVDPKKERVWVFTNPESEDGDDRAEFKRGQNIIIHTVSQTGFIRRASTFSSRCRGIN